MAVSVCAAGAEAGEAEEDQEQQEGEDAGIAHLAQQMAEGGPARAEVGAALDLHAPGLV